MLRLAVLLSKHHLAFICLGLHSTLPWLHELPFTLGDILLIVCLLFCCLVRPSVYGSNGRSYKMLVMFIFIFIFSPTVLRVPSTDRPETLPPDRNLRVFYNASPKIRGALPPKNLGAKNMHNFGRFWTTSDFDREYVRNG